MGPRLGREIPESIFSGVLMVTLHYLLSEAWMSPEGNEFLDSEHEGQIYVPVSVVDTYPVNICGKFPDCTSQGETL